MAPACGAYPGRRWSEAAPGKAGPEQAGRASQGPGTGWPGLGKHPSTGRAVDRQAASGCGCGSRQNDRSISHSKAGG